MMKIRPYYILFVILLLMVGSCVGNEKELFDTSTANRLNQIASSFRVALQHSTFGWVMDYYPSNLSKGGCIYTARFDTTGTVSMASEMELAATSSAVAITPGTEVKSTYQVIQEQGVVLTFDTYNPLFHYWSEPFGSWDTDGYASDYEFIFGQMNVNEDTISLKGKKYGNILTMYKLNMPVATYIHDAMSKKKLLAENPRYRMTVNGKDYRIAINTVTQQLAYSMSNDSICNVPFIFTATGIRLYQPLGIDGVCFQDFVYEPMLNVLSASHGKVVMPSPTVLESFCATNSKWHTRFDFVQSKAEMNEALFKLLYAANEADISINASTLVDFYIGKVRLGQPTALVWKNFDGVRPNECSYLISLKILDASRHIVSITPIEKGLFFDSYSFLQPIVDYLAEANPFILEFDNEIKPTKVRLTSEADSSIWFNLYLD